MGTLNFIGWKKLTVAIPPNILQTEYHYTYTSGIRITGKSPLAVRHGAYALLERLGN